MKTPKHPINEIVYIVDNDTNANAVGIITEITITKKGVRYKAQIGFDDEIIYDEDEYEFDEDSSPCLSIIGRVGYLDSKEEEYD